MALLWGPSGLQAQDFSSINDNLDELERLIGDTLSNNERLTSELASLKANSRELETLLSERELLLSERETSILKQEAALSELKTPLEAMSQIYREQSALSAKYERSLRRWRLCTLVGLPVAVGAGLLAGLMLGN